MLDREDNSLSDEVLRFRPFRDFPVNFSAQLRSRRKKAAPEGGFNNLATTYSRRTLRPTTIGAVVFHGRVRDGNGWDHHAKVTRSRLGMNQTGRDDPRGEAGGWDGRGR